MMMRTWNVKKKVTRFISAVLCCAALCSISRDKDDLFMGIDIKIE